MYWALPSVMTTLHVRTLWAATTAPAMKASLAMVSTALVSLVIIRVVRISFTTNFYYKQYHLLFLTDNDECALGTDDCAHNCNNTFGGFECSCRVSYDLDQNGKNCSGELETYIRSSPYNNYVAFKYYCNEYASVSYSTFARDVANL